MMHKITWIVYLISLITIFLGVLACAFAELVNVTLWSFLVWLVAIALWLVIDR